MFWLLLKIAIIGIIAFLVLMGILTVLIVLGGLNDDDRCF